MSIIVTAQRRRVTAAPRRRAAAPKGRVAALALALTAVALPAPAAFADSSNRVEPIGASSAKVGDTPADFPSSRPAPVATKIGDTPADFPTSRPAPVATKIGDTPADFPPTRLDGVRVGDTPVDFPGMSGAPEWQPVPSAQPAVPDPPPALIVALALLGALGGLALAHRWSRAAGLISRTR